MPRQRFRDDYDDDFDDGYDDYDEDYHEEQRPRRRRRGGRRLSESRLREAQSKKLTAGLCGILIGGFGVHKFILGCNNAGTIMLVVSLLGTIGGFLGAFFCLPLVLLIGPMAMGVIGLVEGIVYLTKSDEDFYEIYIAGEKEWF